MRPLHVVLGHGIGAPHGALGPSSATSRGCDTLTTRVPRPPSFEIGVQLPDASAEHRVTVTPRSVDDTVGDVLTALDSAGVKPVLADQVVVDGRVVEAAERLVAIGMGHGSTLDLAPRSAGDVDDLEGTSSDLASPVLAEFAVMAGPDCSMWTELTAGRGVIGRSWAAQIRIEDPRVELHHALIEADADGVRVTQLGGRAPMCLDGEPITGTRTLSLPSRLTIGMNEIWLRPVDERAPAGRAAGAVGSLVASHHDPWRVVVQRSPDPEPLADPAPIRVPGVLVAHRAPPATGLIGAGMAVLGAGVIAGLMGQMMFALFALFGALASVATWLVGAVGAWRSNRTDRRSAGRDRQRFLDELAQQRADLRRRHIGDHPDVSHIVGTVAALTERRSSRTNVWRGRLVRTGGVHDGGTLVETDGGASVPTCFAPVVGRGSSGWTPILAGETSPDLATAVDRCATIDDVAIPVRIRAGDVVAISGEPAQCDACVRSIVCQLAVVHGPADWRLVVVSGDRDRWEWARWLPHCRTSAGRVSIIDPTDSDGTGAALSAIDEGGVRPTLLVVDDAALFAVRTGPLRRFIERVRPATLTCLDPGAPVPAVCTGVVSVGSTGRVDVIELRGERGRLSAAVGEVQMCGLSTSSAARVARALARLVDPEVASTCEATLASNLALSDLEAVVGRAARDDAGHRAAVSAVRRRWTHGGGDPAPRVAIGESVDGVVEIDLVADGPHALVAGTTGAGKSELLRTLVVGLSLRVSPEHLTFVLVDYKGGSTFDRCAELPHTVGVVTDLDAGLAERALVSLEAELHRRERMLREVGAADLVDYRRHPDARVLPRVVVIIDEFAALAKELPDFLAALVGIAQRGRSLGVHLVLATQRPAGVVNEDIRANTNLRLALRLNDTADAQDVIDDARPAGFGRDVPGRAALRLGPDDVVVFQAARCSGPARGDAERLRIDAAGEERHGSKDAVETPTELDVAVAVVVDAVRRASIDPPHRPWIDPLPERLPCALVDLLATTSDHDGVGIVDDPAAQGRRVLRWQRTLGNLALVGSLGSGTTSTLRALIAARCRQRSADIEHWYVIDARGEASLDELLVLDHVAAVVRTQEHERLHRVLARLVDEIDRRSGVPREDRAVSLAIDGLSSLRWALSSIEHVATAELLERVLADGPAVGVVSCWTDDGTNGSRPVAAADTWVFRCDDSSVARSFGVSPADIEHPGHLRVASCGRAGLVAVDAGSVTAIVSGDAEVATSIEVLPSRIVAAEVTPPLRGRIDRDAVEVDVGLGYDDLEVARLRVPDGDHVFIGGAAGTGKTTALGHVVVMWRSAHPDGRVVHVDRLTPFPPDILTTRTERGGTPSPLLIAVDDADRVDDVDGVLATLISAGSRGVLIVAAGRLDTVRAAYGHWTRDVARSRCGLILTSAGEVDGDLLGATLPRRTPVPARPGLAWLIDGAGQRLVQVVDVQPLDESPSSQRGPAPY